MTTQQLTIGGRKRPVNFTFEVAYRYEETTGRKYMRDLRLLFRQLAEISQIAGSDNTDDLVDATDQISMVVLADIVHTALDYAATERGETLDCTPSQVAGWLLTDTAASAQVFNLLAASMPQQMQEDGEDAKKKREWAPARTKPRTSPGRR